MNSEEIQNAIAGMLSVQRELQNTQLRSSQEFAALKDSISELKQSISDLNEISRRHERRIEQLIGYSITGESDRLDILSRILEAERRINRLEKKDNEAS